MEKPNGGIMDGRPRDSEVYTALDIIKLLYGFHMAFFFLFARVGGAKHINTCHA